MNGEQSVLLKRKLLDVFSRVIKLLDDNGIRWWVAFGTAIGTVRHKGFIPWDDDIDLYVPYEDYKRLLTLSGKAADLHLAIDIPFEPNNVCPYAKVYDTDSTVWQCREYESVIGIWIDIFPLFRADMQLPEYKKVRKNYSRLCADFLGGLRKYFSSDILFYLKGFHLRSLVIWPLDILIRRPLLPHTVRKFRRLIDSLDKPEGKSLFFPYSYSESVMNIYPAECFSETVQMPFEDLMVNIPAGYDEILTFIYGDYMQVPPVEKRVSTHVFYFIDLNKGYTKEQIKALLSKDGLNWREE